MYAHKTTLGWATLVDALRLAGFVVVEAWPLDTEMQSRLAAMESASLSSSIFLIARKREETASGNYEELVRLDLQQIVRERVDTLWEMGISGADLVIACVGAGLRAFTKYARVEYGNGEEVPAERFLAEVETVVLEAILGSSPRRSDRRTAKRPLPVSTLPQGSMSFGATPTALRNWMLARQSSSPMEHTLNWMDSIASPKANRALLEKKKSKYRLLDYTERGNESALGQPAEDGSFCSRCRRSAQTPMATGA